MASGSHMPAQRIATCMSDDDRVLKLEARLKRKTDENAILTRARQLRIAQTGS